MSIDSPPPNTSSGFQGILHLLWIACTIWDTSKVYYSFILLTLSFVVVSSIFETRRREGRSVQGQLFFFFIFWVGLTFFTGSRGVVEIYGYRILIRYIDYLALLIPAFVWVIPSKKSDFFGRSKIGFDELIRNLWKLNFLYLILLNLFWLNSAFEFFALVSMVAEPIYLFQKRDGVPILTLNIFEEIDRKYGGVRSLIGNIFFIQTAVLFGFLSSRFWIIIILIFALAAFILAVFSTIPINQFDVIDGGDEFIDSKKKNISAREMGINLREKLKKPQYTLNHILCTLKEEDLSSGYRVDTASLTFPSLEEDWKPSIGLVLFPIDLGKYDYRREGEILLIGFHKTLDYSSQDFVFAFSRGKGGKMGYLRPDDKNRVFRDSEVSEKPEFMISGDQIKIGDMEFRMKTITVDKNDWINKIRPQLKEIDGTTDISYTGFSNLNELKEKMSSIGKKWIELRKKAQEQVVEFIGGLIGADEAVFAGVDDLKKLESGDEYIIEDVELGDSDE